MGWWLAVYCVLVAEPMVYLTKIFEGWWHAVYSVFREEPFVYLTNIIQELQLQPDVYCVCWGQSPWYI